MYPLGCHTSVFKQYLNHGVPLPKKSQYAVKIIQLLPNK